MSVVYAYSIYLHINNIQNGRGGEEERGREGRGTPRKEREER